MTSRILARCGSPTSEAISHVGIATHRWVKSIHGAMPPPRRFSPASIVHRSGWYERTQRRDAVAVTTLYSDDAVLESPLVCSIFDTASGTESGRAEIGHFLAEGTSRR